MPHTIAIIGAGPSGLAAARALDKAGIRYVGFESADDVGGLWNIDNPRSTIYESAHLISSRTTTQFRELPMTTQADYPGHRELKRYFRAFSDRYDLGKKFRFTTTVERVEPSEDGGWNVTTRSTDAGSGMEPRGEPHTERFDGVILANGTLAHPRIPASPPLRVSLLARSFTQASTRRQQCLRASVCSWWGLATVGAISRWMPCITPTVST